MWVLGHTRLQSQERKCLVHIWHCTQGLSSGLAREASLTAVWGSCAANPQSCHCFVHSRTPDMILVDHFPLCLWQLGTSAECVSQTAEAALWKWQPSGAFCCFSKWQPCCPPSLSILFSSPSLLPTETRNNNYILLSILLAIISLDNHLTFLCLCELLMPSGQRAFKSKAVLLSAVNHQR